MRAITLKKIESTEPAEPALATALAPADGELAAAAAGGDEAAFGMLYRRFVGRVRSILFRLAGAGGRLDDLTQETFLRVWQRLPELRTGGSVAPWIYRIAVNAAHDDWRARRRRPDAGALPEVVDERAAADGCVERQLVALALEALDFDHRTVLVLHDLEQLTGLEIAAALGIPPGTVKSRLHHARGRVRAFLRAKGVEP